MALSQKWISLLGGILICLVTFTAYIPSMQGGFIWDDDYYVVNNKTLRNIEGLQKIWLDVKASPQYYPMVFTSFWIEYHLWQLKPIGYHLINILLHIGTALLLWNVLLQLNLRGAWIAAAVFALHPVHVESVAWITERKNVFSGMFYMSTLLVYFRFIDSNIYRADKKNPLDITSRKWSLYAISLFLFLCALLSKTVTASLPAVIIAILWWKQDRVHLRDILYLLPFFVIGLIMGLLTVWLEKFHVAAEGIDWKLSFTERFLIAGRALWFYAYKLIWPDQLTFIYPHWQIDSGIWWQYLFPSGFLILILTLLFFIKKTGKGPLASVLIFAGTLFPALGFIDVYPFRYSFVADHFQYLASISLIILFVQFSQKIFFMKNPKWIQPGKKERVNFIHLLSYFFAVGLILSVLGVLTWKQGHIYKDVKTLWMDTIQKDPSSSIGHNNLGNYLLSQGKLDKAINHFQKALWSNPEFPEAHNNIGLILAQQGKFDKAIDHLNKALWSNPGFPEAHNSIGLILAQQGKLDKAIDHFNKALRINPTFVMPYFNLGIALSRQGKHLKAIEYYKKALYIKPEFLLAHFNLGVVLARQGKVDEAIEHFNEALKIRSDFVNAHINLGIALTQKGKSDEAKAHFLKAKQIRDSAAKL